jgi:hypothetical protein
MKGKNPTQRRKERQARQDCFEALGVPDFDEADC